MPTNEPSPDNQLDVRLRRLGNHLDAERHAHHGMVADGSLSGGAGRDPSRYRWLAAAAMIVAAVAAATFVTVNRGTSSGPASTGTTMASPTSTSPSATSSPATTMTTLSSVAPPETTSQSVATVPVPSATEPVDTTPTETAPLGTPPPSTPLLSPTTADLCRPPYGPVSAPCLYPLQEGDSPMSVSEQFGITLEAFMAANPLADSDLSTWLVGTEVLIPAA